MTTTLCLTCLPPQSHLSMAPKPASQTPKWRLYHQPASHCRLCAFQSMSTARSVQLHSRHISSVAALSNLTKLHLTFHAQPDFRPLAQLTKIDDLALQCSGSSSDCSHVIDSNRHGLQSLSIASRSRTDSTYAAAANVETLRTTVVKVERLTDAGARLVANLVHPDSVQVLICSCQQMSQQAFLNLSYGQAKITVLELWNIDVAQCNTLRAMHSLRKMTLISPKWGARNTIFVAL